MSYYTILHKINGDLYIYDNSLITIIPLLNSEKIDNIACGEKYIIIRKDGNLFVLGINEFGQLGLGDTIDRYKLTLLPLSCLNQNNILIACGVSHTLIYIDNILLAFGLNEFGQLGLDIKDNFISIPTPINNCNDVKLLACGGYHSLIYKNNGDLLVFGSNYFGQLGISYNNKDIFKPTLLLNDKDIKSIHCGQHHSIICKNNNDLLVFGCNYNGQLGLGDNKDRSSPSLLHLNNKNIKIISCGNHHTMIYTNNGDLLGFGHNTNKQLILNNYTYIYMNKPTLLMNDKNIKTIHCGSDYSIIYKNDGSLLYFGFFNYDYNNGKILLNDPSIIRFNNQVIPFEWSPVNHKYFSNKFHLQTLILYKCLNRIQSSKSIKIPKFVIYEIIKFLI